MKTINTRATFIGENTYPTLDVSLELDATNHIANIRNHKDKSNLVAIPGFFNAHIHAADIGIRGKVGKDLARVVGPGGIKEDYLNSLAPSELVKNITTVYKESINNAILGYADFREGGLQGILPYLELPKSYVPLARPKITEFDQLPNGISIGIRDVVNYEPEIMIQLSKKIHNNDGIVEIHISEDVELRKHWFKEYGMSDLEWAISNLKPETIIHGTHLDQSDIDLLVSTNTNLVICPSSNQYFNVGRPPVDAFFETDLHIGLGSDNAMVNQVALWQEFKLLARWGISISDIYKSATVEGALTAGQDWGINYNNSNFLVYNIPDHINDDELLEIILQENSLKYLQEIIQPTF